MCVRVCVLARERQQKKTLSYSGATMLNAEGPRIPGCSELPRPNKSGGKRVTSPPRFQDSPVSLFLEESLLGERLEHQCQKAGTQLPTTYRGHSGAAHLFPHP